MGLQTLSIASWFYDRGEPITYEKLMQTKEMGGSADPLARVQHFPLGWRWRELNPRPDEATWTFSGRS